MDAKLGRLAAANALGPGVAQQAVAEQPELMHGAGTDVSSGPLGTETRFREDDRVIALGTVTVDRSARARAGFPRRAAGVGQLHEHVRQRCVALVAHVTDQHRRPSPSSFFPEFLARDNAPAD